MNKLTVGSKAYFDSFAGLIPGKVVSIKDTTEWLNGSPSISQTVWIKLTATRGAYKRGEIIESNGYHVVPRTAVFVRNGQYRIRNNYTVGV